MGRVNALEAPADRQRRRDQQRMPARFAQRQQIGARCDAGDHDTERREAPPHRLYRADIVRRSEAPTGARRARQRRQQVGMLGFVGEERARIEAPCHQRARELDAQADARARGAAHDPEQPSLRIRALQPAPAGIGPAAVAEEPVAQIVRDQRGQEAAARIGQGRRTEHANGAACTAGYFGGPCVAKVIRLKPAIRAASITWITD
jgi:hypothetical protein